MREKNPPNISSSFHAHALYNLLDCNDNLVPVIVFLIFATVSTIITLKKQNKTKQVDGLCVLKFHFLVHAE